MACTCGRDATATARRGAELENVSFKGGEFHSRRVAASLLALSCAAQPAVRAPALDPEWGSASSSARALTMPVHNRLLVSPQGCRLESPGRLAIHLDIENRTAAPVGIELGLVPLPEWSPEFSRFDHLFDAPVSDPDLVTVATTQCGPGPRTRLVLARGERIAQEAIIEYSGSQTEAGIPIRMEASFAWEEFPPEASYERRMERTLWFVCVFADRRQCIVIASDARC